MAEPDDLRAILGTQLQSIIASSLDSVIVIDAEGVIAAWSGTAEQAFGWQAQEVIGRGLAAVIFPEDARMSNPVGRDLWDTNGVTPIVGKRLDMFAARRGGELFPVEISVTNLPGVGTQYFLVYIRDTTRWERDARLSAILDSCFDAIIGTDLSGIISSWNSGAELLYGFSKDEAIGKSISIISPSGHASKDLELIAAIKAGKRLEQFQALRQRKDGASIPISATASPVFNAKRQMIGVSTIERDVSNQLRREKELEDARQAAADANRARGEFLANVSHELRTPMNAIIGMIRMTLDEELSPEVRDYVTTANGAAYSLLTLLNDILDFSKLESGKFTITNEPFRLTELVDELVKAVAPQAFSKGLELICDLPADLPRQVIGDSMRLRQVLTNLLSNAIKFTDHGEVIVRVQVLRLWPTEVRLRFLVNDTGIGIPAKDQQRILEPFVQIDSSSTRKHGGTGLGLAICSELLRMMGGRIALSSAEGIGSTFEFCLSFDLPHDATKDSVDGLPFENLRDLPVLVVDDNDSTCRLISDALITWSMKPVIAKGASQALNTFQGRTPQGRQFGLAIIDAKMPDMDGYELASKIAARSPVSQLPIILMASSFDRRELRARGDDSHIAVVLQKPVTQTGLLDAVMRAIYSQPPQRVSLPIYTPSGKPFTSLSILLAEDTPANQKVVKTILTKRGHTVTVAPNGQAALELWRRQPFDAILLDIQMPILDGYQAAVAIRKGEKGTARPVPIIAMTAHAMRGDRQKCLGAGMDAYLAKPIDAKQLIGLVESLTETATTDLPASSSAVRVMAAPSPIDYVGTMKRFGNDRELFREFIGYYDQDAPSLFSDINAAILGSDPTALRFSAHSLKGLAANLGATSVVQAVEALELSGKSRSFQDVATQLLALRREMARLNEALREYRDINH